MRSKANAYQDYNQAAVLDKLLAIMPELARALSEPLSKVDKITVISTGAMAMAVVPVSTALRLMWR